MIKTFNCQYCSKKCQYAQQSIDRQGTIVNPSGVPWNKGRAHIAVRGVNNVNWKGGITPENEKMRKSFSYRKWRNTVFERDDYTCRGCYQRGGKLNADHIKPFALFPELRLNIDNGRTLCEDCHRKTPTYGHGTVKLLRRLQ